MEWMTCLSTVKLPHCLSNQWRKWPAEHNASIILHNFILLRKHKEKFSKKLFEERTEGKKSEPEDFSKTRFHTFRWQRRDLFCFFTNVCYCKHKRWRPEQTRIVLLFVWKKVSALTRDDILVKQKTFMFSKSLQKILLLNSDFFKFTLI